MPLHLPFAILAALSLASVSLRDVCLDLAVAAASEEFLVHRRDQERGEQAAISTAIDLNNGRCVVHACGNVW
jgi:hypothetical protein